MKDCNISTVQLPVKASDRGGEAEANGHGDEGADESYEEVDDMGVIRYNVCVTAVQLYTIFRPNNAEENPRPYQQEKGGNQAKKSREPSSAVLLAGCLGSFI